jgi:hypothetical protein
MWLGQGSMASHDLATSQTAMEVGSGPGSSPYSLDASASIHRPNGASEETVIHLASFDWTITKTAGATSLKKLGAINKVADGQNLLLQAKCQSYDSNRHASVRMTINPSSVVREVSYVPQLHRSLT